MFSINFRFSFVLLIIFNLSTVFLVANLTIFYLKFPAGRVDAIVRKQLNNTRSLIREFERIRNQSTRVDLEQAGNQFEELRFRLQKNILEFQYFIFQDGLQIFDQVDETKIETPVPDFKAMVRSFRGAIANDMENFFSKHEKFHKQRQRQLKDLTKLVQQRIRFLQNPKNCSAAKKLVCYHRNECGLGCDVHHLVNCFTLAYAMERMLVINPKDWIYHKEGYEDVYFPLSDTCKDERPEHDAIYNYGSDGTEQTILLASTYYQNNLTGRPKYFPTVIPDDLAPTLLKYNHGNPGAWWVGQFVSYLMRIQPKLQNEIDARITSNHPNMRRPLVGIHVRRTDKLIREAGFYPLEDYMRKADEYYDQLELNEPSIKRRVYISTDDPSVLDEVIIKFPHYEVIANRDVADLANVSTRYTDFSLFGLNLDIYILSRSDFIICTLTSQVCRIAYEIMQTLHADASRNIFSLDAAYYFNEDNPHKAVVTLPHKALHSFDTSVAVGTVLEVFPTANQTLGWSIVKVFAPGKNMTAEPFSFVPTFKTKRIFETLKFPTYPESHLVV